MILVSDSLKQLAQLNPDSVYLVGGSVRNAFLGLPASDTDITGCKLSTELALPSGFKCVMVNEKLGTAVISVGNERYEYTPFRTENYAKGGCHTPTSVAFTTDIYADSLRRDFTMGAVYYNVFSGEYTDFFGGIADIKNKLVRAHLPSEVFSADGLRILRMVRQASELGFSVEPSTFNTAKEMVAQLNDISKERIRDELNKILVADTRYGVENAHYQGIRMLGELGAWKYIFPPLEDCMGSEQNIKYHQWDVYGHTLVCCKNAPPSIRLPALLHDIGKPVSMARIGKAYMHPQIGAEMAHDLLGQKGLKYPKEVITRACRLIENHMYNKDGNTSKAKLRRFVAKNRDILHDLVDLVNADCGARGEDGYSKESCSHQFLETEQEMLRLGIPFSVSELKVKGTDLLALGCEDKSIGKVLNELLELCITERVNNSKPELLLALKSYNLFRKYKNN